MLGPLRKQRDFYKNILSFRSGQIVINSIKHVEA